MSWPLSADADRFVVADNCAALVSVLVEIEYAKMFTALCERLLLALLHDMVWLLAEFVREPRITIH
ncbi:hypothetical protein KIJ47_08855 [Enterobacter asburiae]|nr:hypothetical protein KIJ47_08855 [Enterobacter asburiae]